jgi:raffinose/stachyose/melibiose transport system permease protein
MSRRRYTWRLGVVETALIALALVWWMPFYIMVTTSLKPTFESYGPPFSLPSRLEWGNYSAAWHANGTPLGHPVVSSLVITVASVVLLVVFGSMASYAVARLSRGFSTVMYYVFVVGILLPYELAVIPAYAVVNRLGMVGTYVSMVILYLGLMMPMTVFMYTSFIRALPLDYEEAARVDGASVTRTFRRVVFPLLRPATGTIVILMGLIIWNEFFMSLIFLGGSPNATLPVAVARYAGEQEAEYNTVLAAVSISVLPFLFFFLIAQRQFMRSFTGGIKQ